MNDKKGFESQHTAFAEGEANNYFQRNYPAGVDAVGRNHLVIQALRSIEWPAYGRCLDVGGCSGGVSAEIATLMPEWSFTVTDPSSDAVVAGKQAFPAIDFRVETAEDLSPTTHGQYDLVVVAGVFEWIDRNSLARVVANIDAVLRHQGHLVISHFDPAFPRINEYKYRSGLFTYKQNYTAIFTSLGTYDLLNVWTVDTGSCANSNDPYDRRWATSVLRKTMNDRYCR